MELTATLAGFFGAHAIWSVSQGEQLVPILGFARNDQVRDMTRLEGETLEDAVRHGLEWLERNPDGVKRAVLVYDGFITTNEGRRDAVLVEARDYEAGTGFAMAIAYRPAEAEGGFAVFKPAFVDLPEAEARVQALSEAFFRGVNENRPGAKAWKAAMAAA